MVRPKPLIGGRGEGVTDQLATRNDDGDDCCDDAKVRTCIVNNCEFIAISFDREGEILIWIEAVVGDDDGGGDGGG